MALIFPIDRVAPLGPQVAAPARLLREGALVAFPTETVYGLGACAMQPQAVHEVFRAKGRPNSDPLIVHLADRLDLGQIAASWPEYAAVLFDSFWPGPFTVVLPKRPEIDPLITAGLETVAIRLPGDEVARALIRAAECPLVGPSANRFGHVSPTTAHHVADDLGDAIAAIVDGGPCEGGIESTVVVLEPGRVRILRPGGISADAIRRALPGHVLLQHGGGRSEGPGLLDRHYAPAVPATLLLGAGASDEARKRVLAAGARSVALLAPDAECAELAGLAWRAVAPLGATHRAWERALYASLRTLEASGAVAILIVMPPDAESAEGLLDRLRRAADAVVRCDEKGEQR